MNIIVRTDSEVFLLAKSRGMMFPLVGVRVKSAQEYMLVWFPIVAITVSEAVLKIKDIRSKCVNGFMTALPVAETNYCEERHAKSLALSSAKPTTLCLINCLFEGLAVEGSPGCLNISRAMLARCQIKPNILATNKPQILSGEIERVGLPLTTNIHAPEEIYNQGVTYAQSGNFERAITTFRQCLEPMNHKYGEMHPYVSELYSNLALMYASIGMLTAAVNHFQTALDVRRKTLDGNIAKMVDIYEGLGEVYSRMGDYHNAKFYFDNGLRYAANNFGFQDLRTVQLLTGVARTLHNLHLYDEALKYYHQILRARNQLNAAGLTVADVLYNMALTYHAKSEPHQALELLDMALKSYKTNINANYSKMASVLNNLGVIHLELGDLEKARTYFRYSLAHQMRNFGREDIKITDSLRNLGILYWRMGRGVKALLSFTKALTITERSRGLHHINTGELYATVAWAWMGIGIRRVARKLMGRSRAILEAVVGRDHPLSLRVASWMVQLAFGTKNKVFRQRTSRTRRP